MFIPCTRNLGVLIVKLHSSNVIKMSKISKQTPRHLVVPYFNLRIIFSKGYQLHEHPITLRSENMFSVHNIVHEFNFIVTILIEFIFKSFFLINSNITIIRFVYQDELYFFKRTKTKSSQSRKTSCFR